MAENSFNLELCSVELKQETSLFFYTAKTFSYFCFSAASIFSVSGVHLAKDPGYRSGGFAQSQGKSRRQSMLL